MRTRLKYPVFISTESVRAHILWCHFLNHPPKGPGPGNRRWNRLVERIRRDR